MADTYTEIEFNGERLHVLSLEGYEGCAVISTCVGEPDGDDVALLTHEHVKAMHAQKALEAAAVLSGIALTHGVLVEEAKATNVKLETLAKLVYSKSEAARTLEVSRRIAKTNKKA